MQTCASEAFAALWPAVADTRIHPPDESARDPARAFTTPPENVQDIAYRYRLYPEPGFEYISPSAAAITGHTPEEHYADPDLGARLVFPQGRPSHGDPMLESAFASTFLARWVQKDGTVLWTFDTNKTFQTVNGVTARGGSMDGPGPIVVGGMLYVNSGYGGLIGNPGNVLLAFSVE